MLWANLIDQPQGHGRRNRLKSEWSSLALFLVWSQLFETGVNPAKGRAVNCSQLCALTSAIIWYANRSVAGIWLLCRCYLGWGPRSPRLKEANEIGMASCNGEMYLQKAEAKASPTSVDPPDYVSPVHVPLDREKCFTDQWHCPGEIKATANRNGEGFWNDLESGTIGSELIETGLSQGSIPRSIAALWFRGKRHARQQHWPFASQQPLTAILSRVEG